MKEKSLFHMTEKEASEEENKIRCHECKKKPIHNKYSPCCSEDCWHQKFE